MKWIVAVVTAVLGAAFCYLLFLVTLASIHIEGPISHAVVVVIALLAGAGIYRMISGKPLKQGSNT